MLVVVSATLFMTLMARQYFERGQVFKSAIPILLLVLLIVAGVVGLTVYNWAWREVRKLAVALRRDAPAALVLAVRLPSPSAPEQWSWLERPRGAEALRKAAVVIDNDGLAFWRPSNPPVLELQLEWSNVGQVVPAEYVEIGTAFEGIAIVPPIDTQSIILQVGAFAGPFLFILDGKRLVPLAAEIRARRP